MQKLIIHKRNLESKLIHMMIKEFSILSVFLFFKYCMFLLQWLMKTGLV